MVPDTGQATDPGGRTHPLNGGRGPPGALVAGAEGGRREQRSED